MTKQQPDALRLADALDSDYYDDVRCVSAAAELRRLHDAYECNTAIMHARTKRMNELLAINTQLLEALEKIDGFTMSQFKSHQDLANECQEVASAAIAAAMLPAHSPSRVCRCPECISFFIDNDMEHDQ